MNLYELAPQIKLLQQRFEESEDHEIEAALTALHTHGVAVVENVVKWIRDLEAFQAALGEEEDRLAEKRKAAERKEQRLRQYLLGFMKATGAHSLDAGIAKLSRRKPSSKVVVDPSQVINWPDDVTDRCVSYPAPQVNKAELKRIPGYEKLPGVSEIEGEESLTIR